mmetsp:Transcript_85849/g.270583  ORF Transcript_85849/g.270583 Transcript_85849/m.270583 type:complete len:200 (-) Transcript_85849:143-742(-)
MLSGTRSAFRWSASLSSSSASVLSSSSSSSCVSTSASLTPSASAVPPAPYAAACRASMPALSPSSYAKPASRTSPPTRKPHSCCALCGFRPAFHWNATLSSSSSSGFSSSAPLSFVSAATFLSPSSSSVSPAPGSATCGTSEQQTPHTSPRRHSARCCVHRAAVRHARSRRRAARVAAPAALHAAQGGPAPWLAARGRP